VQQGIRH
jgi:hypothetical protein